MTQPVLTRHDPPVVPGKFSCREPLIAPGSPPHNQTALGRSPSAHRPSPCCPTVSCMGSRPGLWPPSEAAQGHTPVSQKTQVTREEAYALFLALQPRGFLKHSPALSDLKAMSTHKQELTVASPCAN